MSFFIWAAKTIYFFEWKVKIKLWALHNKLIYVSQSKDGLIYFPSAIQNIVYSWSIKTFIYLFEEEIETKLKIINSEGLLLSYRDKFVPFLKLNVDAPCVYLTI